MRINHKTPDKTVQIDMTIAKLVFILIPITSALLDSQTSKEESFDVVKTVVSEFINIQQVPHCRNFRTFFAAATNRISWVPR